MRNILIFSILSLLLSIQGLFAQAPFSRGINLTEWFQAGNVQKIQFTKYTKQDFTNIKSLGCDVIRLPINMHYMTFGAPDYKFDPVFFTYLDSAVTWAEELHLYLLLDNHTFNPSVKTDTSVGPILVKVWAQMAEHYKDRSKYIMYEILNEPHDISTRDWSTIQQNVINAIRAKDNRHTIIVGGSDFNRYSELNNLPAYTDNNLIYTFHFYDPFLFSHQGTSWTGLRPFSHVPFPYNAAKMPARPALLKSNAWLDSLVNYYPENGTEAKVKSLVDIAVNFRNTRKVRIFCGEFGAYIPNSDNSDRVYWYKVLRKYLEEKGIPWTSWDYQGSFGLFKAGSGGKFDSDLNIPLLHALGFNVPGQNQNLNFKRLALKCDDQSNWWAGIIDNGYLMPLKAGYNAETENNNYNNQIQPLLLSRNGEVIWCDEPLSIQYTNDSLILESNTGSISYTKAGGNLRQAYQFASNTYFHASGKMPDKLLFSNPQYNTWIELMYDQNQKDILRYANAIISNGMPAGVLMIDDNWQEDYGKLNFHPGRFPSPRMMIDSLHAKGFKVMLWVCPFISPDCDVFRYLSQKSLLLKDNSGNTAIIKWWNGSSALLDFTNPDAVKWFKTQLNKLVDEYHVDGFKFDAGDFNFYKDVISFEQVPQSKHTELFAKIGLDYPLNEYRAMWKMGGQPIANRLCDKNHNWEDLQKLIPNMILEGLMGYTFSCPDMIGGGEFKSFLNLGTIDQDLIVRSAQCHALMPMMQFSVAPWRILDKTHLDAVKKAVSIRMEYIPLIMQLVKESALTGEPIVKNLEFVFPNQGFMDIKDEFMLGDSILVTPMLEKGKTSRNVILPKGKWKAENGQIFKGGKQYVIDVPVDRIPRFIRLK